MPLVLPKPLRTPAMTSPRQKLRMPTPGAIRNAFNSCGRRQTPNELIDFMATIGPTIGDPFVVRLIAVEVARVANMKPPERKIKYLDNLFNTVNFPPKVAQEVNRAVDRVVVPPEFVMLAERIMPPLDNLTRPLLEPPLPASKKTSRQVMTSPVSRQCYDELMEAFKAVRDNFVDSISTNLVVHSVAPDPLRTDGLDNAVELIREIIDVMHTAATACGMVLHHPESWPSSRPTRLDLVTMLNEAKAREAAVQEMLDAEQTVTPLRKLTAIMDDLVIEYCERTIKSGGRDLRTFPFWKKVNNDTPAPEFEPPRP